MIPLQRLRSKEVPKSLWRSLKMILLTIRLAREGGVYLSSVANLENIIN
jgi:hypothetical protein